MTTYRYLLALLNEGITVEKNARSYLKTLVLEIPFDTETKYYQIISSEIYVRIFISLLIPWQTHFTFFSCINGRVRNDKYFNVPYLVR